MALPLQNEPRDLLLDDDNDIVVTTDLQFSRGITAIAQSCRIRLLMFAGEWFLDLDAGIPYWQQILGKKSGPALVAAQIAFRSALSQVSGVVEVLRCDVSFEGPTRKLTINWQVRTAFGDTPADTLVPVLPGGSA